MCDTRSSFFLIFTIYHSSDSCDRDCEDDPEDATECCPHHHHDEYEKWWEVECFAHHIWHESIILDTLDDEVEKCDEYRHLPRYAQSDDHGWYEREERSDIRDELHDTSDERESEFFLEDKILDEYSTDKELQDIESNVSNNKYTHREYEGRLDPRVADLLYRSIVSLEVCLCTSRCQTQDKWSYSFTFEHHEKCRNSYESPARDCTSDSTDDRYTSTREGWYLCREHGLDISRILLDDIESMFDIVLTEHEKYDFFYIWMKVKSRNPLSYIYALCTINPIDHYSRSICHIVDDNRYERPDDDTPEEKNDNIYSDDCHPCWDVMFFSLVCERIDEDSEKSWYHEHQYDRWEYV